MVNYSDLERAIEDANMALCRMVYGKNHPEEDNSDKAEDCDDGSWGCPDCPWKKEKNDDTCA